MRALGCLLGVLGACSSGLGPAGDDTGPLDSGPLSDDSADTQPPWLDDSGLTRLDDSGSSTDPFGGEQPPRIITIEYSGHWDLQGSPGAWTGLTGKLHVVEWFSDAEVPEEPACWWIYTLSGVASEQTCPGCDATMEVSFSLDAPVDLDLDPEDETPFETGIGACHDYELPPSGSARWRLGYIEDESFIYFDYYGSGIWVPWYQTTPTGDPSRVEWAAVDNTITFGEYVEPDTADTAMP